MGAIETAPEITLMPNDIEGLLERLDEYHGMYSPLFRRREQKGYASKYMEGLVSDIGNKAIEPMALELFGADDNEVRGMQHFISEGAWDDDLILSQHQREVDKDLGDDDGVYIVDGCDFPKQGDESVGVKRQYCGELGKRANCQAGVFLGYASKHGYTILNRRLYLPKEWIKDEAYGQQRKKCSIPKDIEFKTKPELALEMIEKAVREGTLRGRWMAADEAFGCSEEFLDGVAEVGLWYFAEVPHSTMVWLKRPRTSIPEWSGYGRKPINEKLVPGEPEAETVVEIAKSLSESLWSHHTIKEGAKGPIEADFAILQVVASRDGLPGPDVFMIIRRHDKELKIYLCNAPADTPHDNFIRMSGMRWPIEICFENGKQLLGMGDYQVRSWIGWHHHMTLCILSHFFLVRLRVQLKDKAPALTLPQVYVLLKGILPKPEFDAQLALDILKYRQRRNHAAHVSHRKRRAGKEGQ